MGVLVTGGLGRWDHEYGLFGAERLRCDVRGLQGCLQLMRRWYMDVARLVSVRDPAFWRDFDRRVSGRRSGLVHDDGPDGIRVRRRDRRWAGRRRGCLFAGWARRVGLSWNLVVLMLGRRRALGALAVAAHSGVPETTRLGLLVADAVPSLHEACLSASS
jgi:hypothetical protein